MKQAEALQKMKTLITAQLDLMIANDVFTDNTKITKADYIENVYMVIMALGYNAGNPVDASVDILEMKRDLLNLDETALPTIREGVENVLKQFKRLVDVFSIFHFNSTELMSYADAVEVACKYFDKDAFTILQDEDIEEDE